MAPSTASPPSTMRLDRLGVAHVAQHAHRADSAGAALVAHRLQLVTVGRVFSTRSAPSAAKASAMARPMLRLAPVTNAVRPFSRVDGALAAVTRAPPAR